MLITTPEALGKALRNREPALEIQGDLTSHTARIMSVGKIAWTVVAGGMSMAFLFVLRKRSLRAGLVSLGAVAAAAVAVLGPKTAAVAVRISYAGGGVEVLHDLREYTREERDGMLLLRKA